MHARTHAHTCMDKHAYAHTCMPMRIHTLCPVEILISTDRVKLLCAQAGGAKGDAGGMCVTHREMKDDWKEYSSCTEILKENCYKISQAC